MPCRPNVVFSAKQSAAGPPRHRAAHNLVSAPGLFLPQCPQAVSDFLAVKGAVGVVLITAAFGPADCVHIPTLAVRPDLARLRCLLRRFIAHGFHSILQSPYTVGNGPIRTPASGQMFFCTARFPLLSGGLGFHSLTICRRVYQMTFSIAIGLSKKDRKRSSRVKPL